ncbi:response regulator transcription factor [Streptomyces sp. 8K308]|uniref:response regulator transcription factor n=1 Tax=Streptomyces sp. 8K308 TaxID=2530388 RepID=UPI0010494574|nr:response regulator transcription factor [Streptomyces sp. 8K308]TDC13700.1 response regulator transcription factor [Streptomyces sp. 8K308]
MADLIRVLIADDDGLVRAGIALILGADPGIEVVGEVVDGVEAVDAARRLRPDVVLMDIRMPRMDGLAATEELRSGGPGDPGPAIVVLTTFNTDEYVLRALRAGANGFLLKDVPPTDFLRAVRGAAAGESMLSPAVTTRLIDHVVRGEGHDERRRKTDRARASLATLSDREREVAHAIGEGKSNAEIGGELFMSLATVKTYVSRILTKLNCGNRVQVAILVHESRE